MVLFDPILSLICCQITQLFAKSSSCSFLSILLPYFFLKSTISKVKRLLCLLFSIMTKICTRFANHYIFCWFVCSYFTQHPTFFWTGVVAWLILLHMLSYCFRVGIWTNKNNNEGNHVGLKHITTIGHFYLHFLQEGEFRILLLPSLLFSFSLFWLLQHFLH